MSSLFYLSQVASGDSLPTFEPIVDAGTSLVVDHHVRSDFNAETAIQALAATFVWQGLPQTLTFDRDPRFVGSQQTRDFPSALVRFLHCLGIQPVILSTALPR